MDSTQQALIAYLFLCSGVGCLLGIGFGPLMWEPAVTVYIPWLHNLGMAFLAIGTLWLIVLKNHGRAS